MPMSIGDFVETVMSDLSPFLEEGAPVRFHLKVGINYFSDVGWYPIICSSERDFGWNDISFVVKATNCASREETNEEHQEETKGAFQDMDGGHYPETATGIKTL